MEKSFAFSPLIIGCMRFGSWGANLDKSALRSLVEFCLESGLRDFDHADIYGDYTTEKQFGEVLKEAPGLREQLQLTTKCGIRLVTPNRPENLIKSYDLSRPYIIRSVEQSLKNLHTEYLDVLLLHRPDLLMDPHEIAEAFTELKASGKVFHFGVSNFSATQFEGIHTLFPLITNQVEFSPIHLEPLTDGSFDSCFRHGIQPTVWSPFGGGAIFRDAGSKALLEVLQQLGQQYAMQVDQVILSWISQHPSAPVPVLGTTRKDRIRRALKAVNQSITREDWYRVLEASRGKEVA